jgi:hypothetical protein
MFQRVYWIYLDGIDFFGICRHWELQPLSSFLALSLTDNEHTLNEYSHWNVLTEYTHGHAQLVHWSEHTHWKHALCLLGTAYSCPSISVQKAGHVSISAFKKWDTPKFKALSNQKGLKKRDIRDFKRNILQKCADGQPSW